MKTLLALFVLTLSAPCFAAPKVGEPAPDFSLTDVHGKTHALADFKGKYVVLEWTNFGCPFVQKHYGSGNMQALQKTYTGKGVVWLSLCSSAPGKQGNMSADEWKKVEQEKDAAATAVLPDPEGKVGHLYDATNTPDMFVVDPSGKLIYRGAIDNRPTPDAADIKGATNYISAALDEAMAGKPVSEPTTKPYGCGVKY